MFKKAFLGALTLFTPSFSNIDSKLPVKVTQLDEKFYNKIQEIFFLIKYTINKFVLCLNIVTVKLNKLPSTEYFEHVHLHNLFTSEYFRLLIFSSPVVGVHSLKDKKWDTIWVNISMALSGKQYMYKIKSENASKNNFSSEMS